jgi:8-oxo-dGTP diphosphatase
VTDLPHYTDYDTRLAAYALVVDDRDRILLALWNEGDEPRWTLPGGGVELHESVEEAVVRELREETGYDVRVGALRTVDTYVIPAGRRLNGSPRPMKAVRVLFDATIEGGELTHEVEGSTDEARWVPLDEAAGLPHVSLVDVALRLVGRPRRPGRR